MNELETLFPIISEENEQIDYDIRKNYEYYWLVDPLDGTKEFINRNGEFCINLALIERTKPVEAFIYQPLEKKGWFSKRGEGIVEFDNTGKIKKIEKK